MRHRFLLVLAFLAVVSAGCTGESTPDTDAHNPTRPVTGSPPPATATASEGQRHTLGKLSFAEIPGWQIRDGGVPNSVLMQGPDQLANPQTGARPILGVQMRNSEGTTLDGIELVMRRTLSQDLSQLNETMKADPSLSAGFAGANVELTDFNHEMKRTVLADGTPALASRFDAEYAANGVSIAMRTHTLLIVDGADTYVATLVAPAEFAAEADGAWQQLSASLQLAGGASQVGSAGRSPEGASDAAFDVSEFLAKRQPPEPNAADLYLAAMSDWDRLGPATEMDKMDDWISKAKNDGPQFLREVEPVLVAAEPFLKQVDQAQSIPECVFMLELDYNTDFGYLNSARDLAMASLLRLYEASLTDKPKLATAAAKRALRLSRDIRPRGAFICQMISVAIDRPVLQAILEFVLNRPTLTVEQCDQILELLIEHEKEGIEPFEEAVRVEYIAIRRTIENLQAGEPVPEDFETLPLDLVTFSNELQTSDHVYAAALRDAQAPDHEILSDGELEQEIERLSAAVKERRAEAAPIIRYAALNLAMVRDATARIAANLAGAQLLTAVRRFEIAHGKLPSTLAEAAAETALNEVPIDPYSGQEMRFTLLDGAPTVYSVAKDGVDQGGKLDWEFGKKPGDYAFSLPPYSELSPNSVRPSASEAVPGGEAFRIWTSTAGSQLEAEFVRLVQNDSIAVLKRRDGGPLRVRLDQLSDTDREWIQARK